MIIYAFSEFEGIISMILLVTPLQLANPNSRTS